MPDLFEVRMRKSGKWKPPEAATAIQALLDHAQAGITLQIVATHDAIRFVLGPADENHLTLDTVKNILASYYPGGEVHMPEGWGLEPPYYRRLAVLARSESLFFDEFETVDMHKVHDPLSIVMQTMNNLEPGELMVYSVHVHRVFQVSEEGIKGLLTRPATDLYEPQFLVPYDIGLLGWIIIQIRLAIARWGLSRKRVDSYDERDMVRYLTKLRQPLAETVVSVHMDSPNPERLQILSDMLAAIKSIATHTNMRLIDGGDDVYEIADAADAAEVTGPTFYKYLVDEEPDGVLQYGFFLLSPELATLYHLPHEGCTASRIVWANTHVAMPEILKQVHDGIVIGRNNGHVVKLPAEEATMHTIISGKNGTGKSSLVQQMVSQYLALNRGLCVIDPHGQLVTNILRYHIPRGREADVVVLDFADLVHPAALNPLYRPGEISGDIATDMVMSVMSTVYDDFAFREMSDTLHMALTTLSADPEATLLDVQRLFDDVAYRQRLVADVDDFTVNAFWNKFDGLTLAKQNEMTRPVLRRLNAFYRNKALRAIACHPRPLNLRQLMAENKIILISLNADEARMPSEQRELLGAVLVSQFQMAAMAGAIQDGPFMLFIDEAQHFVTTSLDKMLSEARKQGLGLVLANQYLRQLSGSTLEAVEGNVASMITFEVGESDARALSAYMKPEFDVQDLVKLGKYRAAVSTRYANTRQPAFTLETLPPPQANGASNLAAAIAREASLRRLSIENYTPMTYDEVNAWLRDRYLSTTGPAAEESDDFLE